MQFVIARMLSGQTGELSPKLNCPQMPHIAKPSRIALALRLTEWPDPRATSLTCHFQRLRFALRKSSEEIILRICSVLRYLMTSAGIARWRLRRHAEP